MKENKKSKSNDQNLKIDAVIEKLQKYDWSYEGSQGYRIVISYRGTDSYVLEERSLQELHEKDLSRQAMVEYLKSYPTHKIFSWLEEK